MTQFAENQIDKSMWLDARMLMLKVAEGTLAKGFKRKKKKCDSQNLMWNYFEKGCKVEESV